MSTHGSFVLTPHTTLDALFARAPEAEAIIVGLSPDLARVTSPVLRQTLTRVMDLRQVAQAAQIPLSALMRRLQEATGTLAPAGDTADGERPDWARPERVTQALDARAIIDGGGHPMEQVMSGLAALGPAGVFALTTPFVPGPLVEMARGRGFECYTHQPEAAVFTTYFARSGAASP